MAGIALITNDERSRILSNLSLYIDILYIPRQPGKYHISLESLKNAPGNRQEEGVPYQV